MKHLLNLLAAIALLVWGTQLVRAGILRVFGANLRNVLARSVASRWAAAISGLGVTALVQSSTATALIIASFVGQGLVSLPMALAVMLGADVGTSLMTVVFSFLAVIAYSSLAIVLLTATMAASGLVPLDSAMGLVLGANLGSGLLAVMTTSRSAVQVRQVPVGNLVFKAIGVIVLAPFAGFWLRNARPFMHDPATVV